LAFPFREHNSHLTFGDLVGDLRELMRRFPDKRRGRNIQYRMEDVAAAAFSVFFTQSPSFLAHQTALTETQGNSNAQTLFGLRTIPTDNPIRDLLDAVPPQQVFPMFERVFAALLERGQLQAFRVFDGPLLVALEGTQYHRSTRISCDRCTVTTHRNGQVDYAHAVVTPVIVAPGHHRVLPLEPEFITPQDGHQKQDCENAAAKRWISHYAGRYRELGVTLLGDDLYRRQPLCEHALAAGLNFILVCKPSSHPTLYEWLDGLITTPGVHTLSLERRQGQRRERDTYRFANARPLRDGDDALAVNWCELTTTDADGKVLYHNAFVSNHAIQAGHVTAIVQAGRARWKVENENNNTLKTQGYHLTHHFGHGQRHLSALLVTLNLLAFLLHTVLDTMDAKYQLIRAKLPSRTMFFQHIQALTCYLCFESFDALLDFMLRGLRIDVPDTG
jgi:hypothetical protein